MADDGEDGASRTAPRLGEDALRAIYHAVNDAIFVHGPDGDVLDVNETAARMYGYSRAEFREGEMPETSSGEGPFTVDGSIDRLKDVASGDRETFEWQGKDREGNVFWEEVSVGKTVVDGEERMIAIVRDIDERKRYEQELEYRRALLEAQAEATIDGFLVEHGGEVLSYNSRFLELFDVPAEEPPSSTDEPALAVVVDALAAPDSFQETVADLADEPDAERRDEAKLADGRWIDWYSAPVVGDDGEHYGRLWVFRDVTQRKERERELRQKNERLEEFASIVSHDLRNPLSVANGHLALASEESESEHLERVREAHARMERLIDDLLELAREGMTVQDGEPVSLPSLAERCWRHVETGDARLVTEVTGTVVADRGRCRQLLENLYRNAVEYGGDDVTVRVGDLPDGFFVEDDGPGIPADDRATVFESGYSTAPEGTGFGLAIVRTIAEAHGWEVAVTESADGGARFEFTGVEAAASGAD